MINLTFSLTAQIPSGKNRIKERFVRNNKFGTNSPSTGRPYKAMKKVRYPDKRFSEWREGAIAELMGQVNKENWPIDRPVSLIIDYVPSDHRRRDLPGMLDCLCHLIERVGMLTDDALVTSCSWKTFAPDKGKAGCRITVMG